MLNLSKVLRANWVATIVVTALSSVSALAAGPWVAIVYNPSNGHWGSARGFHSQTDAESAALSFCGTGCAGADPDAVEKGQGPVYGTVAYNGWAAVAKGKDNRWGASGEQQSQEAAEQVAFENCGGDANSCSIVRSLSAP